MSMKPIKNLEGGGGSAPISATSFSEGKKMQRLTQQQLEAWWPFTRLDPRLFPRATKQTDPLDDVEESLW